MLQDLSSSVIEGDSAKAEATAKRALERGMDPLLAITDGLNKGMARVGDDFSE